MASLLNTYQELKAKDDAKKAAIAAFESSCAEEVRLAAENFIQEVKKLLEYLDKKASLTIEVKNPTAVYVRGLQYSLLIWHSKALGSITENQPSRIQYHYNLSYLTYEQLLTTIAKEFL